MNLEWTTTSFVRTWLWDRAYRWSFFLNLINVNSFYTFYVTIWFLLFSPANFQTPEDVDKLRSIGVKTIFCLQQDPDLEYPKLVSRRVQLELVVVFFFFLYGILISKYVTLSIWELLASLNWERKHWIPSLVHPDILALTSMPYESMLRHMMTFNTCVQR